MAEPRGVDEDFREFVTARSPALLRTAYLLAGDWATAEDLLQTALTKTYLAWRKLGHIEAVEPYARRVLVNTATSWWRRRWHGERPTDVLPEVIAPDRLDERLERDALWRHVRQLPARQRAVLVLRFYEDQSEADTARLLGVSVGTVKSQCSRALRTLRERLGADGIEPAGRVMRPATEPVPAEQDVTDAVDEAADETEVVVEAAREMGAGDVTMIEDALRQAFAAQVERAPQPFVHIADVAISRARRARQRRTVGSALAGLAVLVLTGTVAVNVLTSRPSDPGANSLAGPESTPSVEVTDDRSTASRAAEAPVEIMVDNEIHLQGNQRLRLAFDAQGTPGSRVTRVYRARDGYLVVTQKESHQQLYRLDEAGGQSVLLPDADYVAVSAGGDRVAWRSGPTMSVASRQGARLGDTQTTNAPATGGPTEFVGSQVLLSRPATVKPGTVQPSASVEPSASSSAPASAPAASASPGSERGEEEGANVSYDRWDPAAGGYTETWSTDVIHVYGALADGKHIVAQVMDPKQRRSCLGLLVAAKPFRIIDTVCGLPPAAGSTGRISPDGRLLAYPTYGSPQLTLIDLSRVFDEATTPQQKKLTAPVRSMVWHDAETIVVDIGDSLVRVPVRGSGKPEQIKVGAGERVLVEPLAG